MHAQDGPTFSTVEDSPIFRSTLSELDESLERLDIRCNRFMKGSKRYKEGINTLSQSQHSFADFLEEFCGGTDEESMILGGDKMSKFVPVFRELATFTEVLHTQIELILVERLHHNWLKGLISGGKESKRHLDKKMADYTAASAKHLHPRPTSKWRRGEDAEKIHSDMIAAQGAAEEARFDRARKMTEVESRKKYEFLEAMCSSMDAHVRFFERGHELLKDLGPYIQQGLQRVQQQKAEEIQHEENLENQIYNYKEQKSARGARAADVAERPPPRPGGPVQLTSGVSANIAAWEPLIKESEETQGGRVMILREGWLLKRSSNIRKEWKRRYFVLDSMGMLYYYSNKEKVDKKKTPYNTVNLLTSTIKSGADEEGLQGLRFCFRVVSPEKVYLLQAEDELDQREWMEAVQGVTACLLNGNVDVEALSRAQPKPSRPTHSRQGSRAGSISSLDDVSFSPLCQQLSQQSSGFSVDMGAALDAEGFGRSSEEQQQSPHAATSPVRRGNPLGRSPLAFAGMKGWEGRRTSHHASSNSMGSIRSPTQADRLLLNQGSVSSLATQGSNKLFPRAASPNSPLELLRRVPGNSVCCDCGSPEPDWASLNLGVLLCIECSGIHRKKGVHVSKVRSLTLDVRIWDEAVLGMMERIGNDVANEAWEAELVNENASNDGAESIGPADKATALDRASSYDSRARSDSDASHQSFSFTAAPRPPQEAVPPQGGGSLSRQGLERRGSTPYSPTPSQSSSMRGAPPHQPPSAKPSADSNNAVKERFITAKYVEKRYAMTAVPAALGTPQTALWEACEGRSIREAVIAVVNGCDMNAPCPCPPAMSLIRDTNNLAGGANAEAPSSPAGFCALHFACQTGDISLIEYLLQNGATWDRSDPYGRTPLHYCILHEHPQAAKQLLKRGADKAAQDVLGQKPLDMSIKQGKVSDEELLMMLS